MTVPPSFPASLRATEREIYGIVYQLFHLTPAELALIEGALL
jgi:hypothetical protein